MTEISEHARAAAKYCHEVTLGMDWGREYPAACEKRIQQAIDDAIKDRELGQSHLGTLWGIPIKVLDPKKLHPFKMRVVKQIGG